MRPLAYHYPGDPNVWELGSQYLLGPDLLVAPVTRPGATHWPVYLPQGRWYDFWTHEPVEGGRGISAPAPLDTIPVFVRRGALIATGPVAQYTDERPLDHLTLLVYPPPPGESSETELYEDDGSTNAYRRGEYATTRVRSQTDLETNQTDRAIRIEVDAASGRYAGQPAHRDVTIRLCVPNSPATVHVAYDGQPPSPLAQVDQAGGPSGAGARWWREAPSLVWVHVPAVPIHQAATATIHHD
jgi:hypothetical protein